MDKKDRWIDRQTARQIDRQKDRLIEREREIDRQRAREIDRQIEQVNKESEITLELAKIYLDKGVLAITNWQVKYLLIWPKYAQIRGFWPSQIGKCTSVCWQNCRTAPHTNQLGMGGARQKNGPLFHK